MSERERETLDLLIAECDGDDPETTSLLDVAADHGFSIRARQVA